MVDRREVFEVADGLFYSNGNVSIRSVIPLLKNGGSHREVGDALRLWKGQKHELMEACAEFPEGRRQKVETEFIRLWQRALADAKAIFEPKLSRLETQRKHAVELMTEALALADRHMAEADGLRAQVVALRAQLRTGKILQRRRSAEFWDRVVHEIAAVMKQDVPKNADDMLDDLSADLRREATFHIEPLTAATIKKKIEVREEHGKLFMADPCKADHFLLRPDVKMQAQTA